ncbi:MAG TPA: phosphotransferase [Myxococcota bacterium]|nr:phosphotransferase [Myxococcota bacterium]
MSSAGEDELLREVASAFELPGRWLRSTPFGGGHINTTVIAELETPSGVARYVQQRINRAVFREPLRVMENFARVIAHQRRALEREGARDLERRVLRLVPARSGANCYEDSRGDVWRTVPVIEGARSLDTPRSSADAGAAAFAFGRFLAQLADLPPPRLHETIPRFHDARLRFEQLEAAAREDAAGRLASCRAEVEMALAQQPLVTRFETLKRGGAVHERAAHNDTKLNNVLIDDVTGEGLCVIDLDTVMPGGALTDFGDLARTAATRAAEDERDLTRVRVDAELFAALAQGFVRGAGASLAESERRELVFGAQLMAYVIGIRFLADYLRGDTYFRVHREHHNLDRARAQLALVADYARRRDELAELCAEGNA